MLCILAKISQPKEPKKHTSPEVLRYDENLQSAAELRNTGRGGGETKERVSTFLALTIGPLPLWDS